MPSAFYIYLPVCCALVALAASIVWLRQKQKSNSDRLYLGVAFALSASIYFAVVFGLLAFVPGPGGSGPIQYAGENRDALALFRFRSSLVSIAMLGIPIVALIDLISLVEASRSEEPALRGLAALALVLLLFGTITAVSTAGSWIPTA